MEIGIKELKEYGKSIKLLIAEDSKTAQAIYSKILSPYFGYIDIADNGKEAIALFLKHSHDLVISDINMPELDGIELSRMIKKINRKTPIIIMTSFSEESNLIELIKIGINRYVKKSNDPQELLEAVVDSLISMLKDMQLKEQEKIVLQQSKLSSMGELLTNIAHQWRQPLNFIALTVQDIKEAFDSGELTRDYLEDVTKSTMKFVKNMSDTIDEFSRYFNTEGKQENFLLADCINSSLLMVESFFESLKIDINIDVEGSISLFGNKDGLQQVIVNILKNSKEAFEENGAQKKSIRISANKHECKDKQRQTIVISIEDSAGGIDEHVIERVFEPYFTTRFQSSGKGLGLYVAKMIIVEQFFGEIEIKNIGRTIDDIELKGTRVQITI